MGKVLLFLVKQRKSDFTKKYTVPLHPELVFVEALLENEWHAQNKNTKQFVLVTRKDKDAFYEYEVTSLEEN